jgi:uncharacterized iron-regulated protein
LTVSRGLVVSACSFVVLTGCGLSPRYLHEDHPLAGRAWDVRAERFVGRDEIIAQAATARVVLLGEVHDNALQHDLQRDFFERIAAVGPPRSAVFEQFDLEQQPAIDAARAARGSARHVVEAGGMASGWNRIFYEPLVAAALSAGWPVRAGNLSRAELQPVMRKGFSSLPPGLFERLAIGRAWNAERDAAMKKLLVESHCGSVPDALAEGLTRAQRLRDATLADVLLAQPGAVVGVMGNGHAQRDIGVPAYVASREPAATLLSVGLLEVAPGKQKPHDYALLGAAHEPLYDFVWFTPRAVRKDPCEA